MTLKAGVTPSTLSDIMTVAQRENLVHQITGFLCFGNGYFFSTLKAKNQRLSNYLVTFSVMGATAMSRSSLKG